MSLLCLFGSGRAAERRLATASLAMAAARTASAVARARRLPAAGHARHLQAAARERPLAATDILLDASPATRVLALWRRGGRLGSVAGRSDARLIARTLPYQTLRRFLGEQFGCVASEEEVARAIELPDSGICGFGMDPAYKDRDSIAALTASLSARGPVLRSRIAANASRYLPEAPSWKRVRVWFVIASQTMFDAATLRASADGDSAPVILANLTEILSYGSSTRERIDTLEHVLAHEAFHAGLHQTEARLPGWADYRETPTSGFAYIRSVMVDEGVAHYIDWRERPGADSMFTWKPCARETYAFEQLAAACRRLKGPTESRADRMEMLQLAGNGPLWSKYGAISGMFAAHRIEAALGRSALRRVLEAGPSEFVRTYREVARRNPRLSGVFVDLIQQ